MINRVKSKPSSWTFLTNHAHVLLCIAERPNLRMRDLAALVGITERAVQRIIADLTSAGYLAIQRSGRCNTYATNSAANLRHPIEAHRHVSDLIILMKKNGKKTHC
jgi:predicted transcriptional regulator